MFFLNIQLYFYFCKPIEIQNYFRISIKIATTTIVLNIFLMVPSIATYLLIRNKITAETINTIKMVNGDINIYLQVHFKGNSLVFSSVV